MTEITITDGFIAACMECHNGKPMAVDTWEEAVKEAKSHLSVTEKPHGDHTMTITPTKLVRLKK
jgi:hypothetical protein